MEKIVEVKLSEDCEVDGYGHLSAGKTYSLPANVAATLNGSGQPETQMASPPEAQAMATGEPKHVGGGYYAVGEERVLGKKAAYERARQLGLIE